MENKLKVDIPLKVSLESITNAVREALNNQEIKLSVYIDLIPKVEEKEKSRY